MQTSITAEEVKALYNAGVVTKEFIAFIFPVHICITEFGMTAGEHKEAIIKLIRKDLLVVGNRSTPIDLVKI